MTRARKTLIALDSTSYYHICVRAVRRSFLCGKDDVSGKNFNHRRQWIEDELLRLSDIFAIQLSAFSIMSNHYHVLLRVEKSRADSWDAKTVVDRWHKLFKGSLQSQAFSKGETIEGGAQTLLDSQVATWQQRLSDISWFMRVINEKIARLANAEDGCTGRFWEGRFKSQALLDEKALMACMAYIDLNPIRAQMAATPEESDHTSVKRRIEALQSQGRTHDVLAHQPKRLEPFVGNLRREMPAGLPYRVKDYLELVDWTGRQIREDKRGFIGSDMPPMLDRLGIDPEHWLYLTQHYESSFKSLVGSVYEVKKACKQLGWKKSHSLSMCKALIG